MVATPELLVASQRYHFKLVNGCYVSVILNPLLFPNPHESVHIV